MEPTWRKSSHVPSETAFERDDPFGSVLVASARHPPDVVLQVLIATVGLHSSPASTTGLLQPGSTTGAGCP